MKLKIQQIIPCIEKEVKPIISDLQEIYFLLNVEAWILLKSIQNSDEQAYPREKKYIH